MVRIAWRWNEVEMFVKSSGVIVFGMNGECPDSRDFSSVQRALHGIFKKSRSERFALPRGCNCKPRKQHDRDRITSEAFGQALRGRVVFDLPYD